jgi:hypothetical protein
VQAALAQPRTPAQGKKCELLNTRGSPEDPVELCYCQEHAFSRSEYRGGFCPQRGCAYGEPRSEDRLRVRRGETTPAEL